MINYRAVLDKVLTDIRDNSFGENIHVIYDYEKYLTATVFKDKQLVYKIELPVCYHSDEATIITTLFMSDVKYQTILPLSKEEYDYVLKVLLSKYEQAELEAFTTFEQEMGYKEINLEDI